MVLTAGLNAIAQERRRTGDEFYEQGVQAMNKGRLNDALANFSRVIAENPGYAEAYSARALVKERLKDNDGALLDYSLSLELLPNQYEVLLSRAVLRFQLRLLSPARDDFKKLLNLPAGETNTIFYRRSAHSPGTDQMLTAQGSLKAQLYNYLGLIEYELGNCNQAIFYLDSALVINNREADYFVNRALAKLECDSSKALDDFKRALEIYPDHPIARHNLAIAAARQGKFELAEKQLTETIGLDSMILDPYLERGYYRMLNKNYKGALSDYNRALSLSDSDPEIWLNRGFVREKLNDWMGAYADYSKAIDLKNDFTMAWLNRGNLLADQFRFDEAIEDYSVAILYQPDYEAAFYNRAMAKYRIGKSDDACADLLRAEKLGMKIDPSIVKKICEHAK